MTVYAWPDAWAIEAFEMRVKPSAFVSAGPYSPYAQVSDLAAEIWVARIDLPAGVDNEIGAAREAFFDRLNGPFHQISLHHLRRPEPLGTLRDGVDAAWSTVTPAPATWSTSAPATATWVAGMPTVVAAIAQGGNTASIRTLAGKTLKAGDHIKFGGKTVRVMADATADGTGLMSVEFKPRARAAIAAYSAVTWSRPTVTFMLKSGSVPTVWRQGMFEGVSIELVEAP